MDSERKTTGVELIAAMQASPYQETEIEPTKVEPGQSYVENRDGGLYVTGSRVSLDLSCTPFFEENLLRESWSLFRR